MSLSIALNMFLSAYSPIIDEYSPFTPVSITKQHKLSHKQPSVASPLLTLSRRKADNLPHSPPSDSSNVQTALPSLTPPPLNPVTPVQNSYLVPTSYLPMSSPSTSLPSPSSLSSSSFSDCPTAHIHDMSSQSRFAVII